MFKPYTNAFTPTLLVPFIDENALKIYNTESKDIKLIGIIISHMEDAITTDTLINMYLE